MNIRLLVLTGIVMSVLPGITQAASGDKDFAAAWWSGPGATGDWGGIRPILADRGLTFTGKWLGTVYGAVDGGRSRAATFDQELKFEVHLDFQQLTGWEALEGLTAHAAVRYRDGNNINDNVGASPSFNPSSYQTGKEWRLMPFYLTYTTPHLFGVQRLLTLTGGWMNPYENFARQEDAKLFRNLIFSSKGISSNGVGWSSSYASWGGLVKVEPCAWSYAQAGLYLAVPGDIETANHGLEMAGVRPAGNNGVFALGEAGVTPKIAGLPGKYGFGGYYWGLQNHSFLGGTNQGKFGLYWMADQTLYKPAKPSAQPGDGKTSLPAAPKAPDTRGLRWLGFVNYAPPANNALPFFFYTGLVYEGLIPTREHDLLGVAVAWGNYSYDRIVALHNEGDPFVKTNEGVLEFDYRLQLNRWAYAQPFVQYIINPGAERLVSNATVIGLHLGVTF